MQKCLQCQNDFQPTQSDEQFYKKIDVPAPKNCPDCRLVRRFMERNPKNLYYRKCDLSGTQTLSQYHKDQPFPVYNPESWWSDRWDALKYGEAYDFHRSFFEQYLSLKNKTPHLALFNTQGTIQNSDFNNCTAYLKNCYLIAESDYCEECYFSNLLKKCTSVVDCAVCYQDELCYECVDCTGCYRLLYSQDCQNCHDSYFLNNCSSCSNCIGCINQRHKEYMVFNTQYSKNEYEKIKRDFALHAGSGVKKLRTESEVFFLTQPHKALIAEKNEQSSGDHLFNSKNSYHCFDSLDLEDCSYCAKLSLGVKSSMDYNSWGNQAELLYQCSSCGDHCYNLKFCVNCQSNMNNCEYCAECFSCSDCFGCVGLKNERFCILNKKYSEKEYRALKTKIIDRMRTAGEYGEFFPLIVCPFAYNESMAMDAFPLMKKDAIARGLRWRDDEKTSFIPQSFEIPTSIFDASDDITRELFACECKKNFKIISREFDFYKRLGIPIPYKCPLCRHKNRMKMRKPLKLWERNCAKCSASVQTNYAPERPEVIFCEACYLKEVY